MANWKISDIDLDKQINRAKIAGTAAIKHPAASYGV